MDQETLLAVRQLPLFSGLTDEQRATLLRQPRSATGLVRVHVRVGVRETLVRLRP